MAAGESYSIKSDKRRGTAPGFVKFFMMVYFWGLIGFALGTVILLGPVRWWAGFCRDRGFSSGFESGGVVTLILILIVASMSLALWATTEWVRTRSIVLKFVIPVVVLGVAYYAYAHWMNPSSMQSSMAKDDVASQHFTFGPFPDEAKLRALKKDGYTAVISLLHPAVVPFEPQLIGQEEADAKAVGLEIVHLPMLPWVSDNKESLDRLREIAESKKGRYYIHCYLGKDRVNVARRVIELAVGAEVISGANTRKSLADRKTMERGEIIRLKGEVYLTPYPTEEELNSYFLSGEVETVVALLDPDGFESAMWVQKERDTLASARVKFVVVSISDENYDSAAVLKAVEVARSAAKPVVVHAFLPISSGRSPAAEAFLQAWTTGKPPIPPSLLVDPVGGLPVTLVAPNVAVGETPSGKEWRRVLERAGVRHAIFGGPEASANPEDRVQASQVGLAWTAVDQRDELIDTLASGGPYYVYGPLVAEARERISELYGPGMPDVGKRGE